MRSLKDYFKELELHFALICESWLRDDQRLREEVQNLELVENLSLIMKNRKSHKGKIAGGGVAVVFDKSRIKLSEYKIKNGCGEIVCAGGKIPSVPRKVFLMSIYIPPRMKAPQNRATLERINGTISTVKEEMDDPIIIVGGTLIKGTWMRQWETSLT